MTKVSIDDRLKPKSLHRHQNSDFEQYLHNHARESPHMNASPYPTDESGRSKKTQVLDHIIKIKKNRAKRNESLKK